MLVHGHYFSLFADKTGHLAIFCFHPVGCGVGERAYAQTAEAPPKELSPPVVTATGSTSIEVKWLPPKKSNGIIRNYFVYR